MEIVYTLGYQESYDKGLVEYREKFQKQGRTNDFNGEGYYPGGWIWKTAQEAETFRQEKHLEGYAVYAIKLVNGWEQDVSVEVDEDGIHSLLTTSQIISRVDFRKTQQELKDIINRVLLKNKTECEETLRKIEKYYDVGSDF